MDIDIMILKPMTFIPRTNIKVPKLVILFFIESKINKFYFPNGMFLFCFFPQAPWNIRDYE